MMEWLRSLYAQLPDLPVARTVLTALLALAAIRLGALLARRTMERRFSAQAAMLADKLIWYSGFLGVVSASLAAFGVNLGALLGAAGIAGIAVGFASQSSLSNIISGFFLVTEKPFQVGDLIRVGSTLGVVHSVDLLSVKVRTLDNQYVRIPNENLIKTDVVNITRFPIRRMDTIVSVAYKEDLSRVVEVLRDVAEQHPKVLDNPEPLVLVNEFADSGIDIRFGVWFCKTDYIEVKNGIMIAVKERFDAEGIEIPFPHRTIYTGSATTPLPVSVTTETPNA